MIRETVEHPVPRDTASWFYVFGSAALTVFLLQVVTGILLALIYVPSAGEAWKSLEVLNHTIPLGIWKGMLLFCHPDKWQGEPGLVTLATAVTRWLLEHRPPERN